jgi:hypothetical protein
MTEGVEAHADPLFGAGYIRPALPGKRNCHRPRGARDTIMSDKGKMVLQERIELGGLRRCVLIILGNFSRLASAVCK